MGRKSKPTRRKKPFFLRRRWEGMTTDRRTATLRTAWRAALAVALLIGVGVGFLLLESAVLGSRPEPETAVIRMRLLSRPGWMPAALARDIAVALQPDTVTFNDPGFTAAVYDRAAKDPWIRKVHNVSKSRADDRRAGIVEVQAEYRRPFAKVLLKDLKTQVYVDRERVRLPDRPDLPKERYLLIEGVSSEPPAVGARWDAADLADGLRLVEWVRSRPYWKKLTVVCVSNYRGRVSPYESHLSVFAQVGKGNRTRIRFGRFPASGGGDYVILPEQKMASLDKYVKDHYGRLAGIHRWIDLRHDQLETSLD